jgi:hypothetical protein
VENLEEPSGSGSDGLHEATITRARVIVIATLVGLQNQYGNDDGQETTGEGGKQRQLIRQRW